MLCAEYEASIGVLNAELKEIEIAISHNQQAVKSLSDEIAKTEEAIREQEETQVDNRRGVLPQFFVHFSTSNEINKLEKKKATFKEALLISKSKLNGFQDLKKTAIAKREKLLKELEKAKNNVLEGPWTTKK